MGNEKISASPAALALDGTELVVGVQSLTPVKITIAQIKAYITGAGGGELREDGSFELREDNSFELRE